MDHEKRSEMINATVISYEPQTVEQMLKQIEEIQMKSNEKQIAGSHYKSDIQHWDYVVANDLDYFQAQITKYVTRWKKKNGMTDLLKAQHFLEKYIEVMQNSEETSEDASPAYVNQ